MISQFLEESPMNNVVKKRGMKPYQSRKPKEYIFNRLCRKLRNRTPSENPLELEELTFKDDFRTIA
jgi:hypothetical protein